MQSRTRTLLACTVALISVAIRAAETTAEDTLRQEVAREYANPRPDVRKAALDKLGNCKDFKSWQMIAQAVSSDADGDVRAHGVGVLCRIEDLNGALAGLVASCLRSEKVPETFRQMANSTSTQAFKFEILNELCAYTIRQRYPDVPNWNNNSSTPIGGGGGGGVGGGGAGLSQQNNTQRDAQIKASRVAYEALLQSINSLSGQTFKPHKDSPSEVKKWWERSADAYRQKDAELRAKLNPAGIAKLFPGQPVKAEPPQDAKKPAAEDNKDPKNAE